MPVNCVNLDALILRQDFDPASPSSKPGEYEKIYAADLLQNRPLFSMLRKPDFQRETAIWTPQQVADLILAFTEEDLVPALILWRSVENHVFVIDGAHRLSSIIAWVNSDYGMGKISQQFFEGDVSEHEKAARAAKELAEQSVGAYKDIDEAFSTPNSSQKYKELAGRLNQLNLKVQWLNGDGKRAERSFFKINRQGVPLTNTELTLLHSRRCPNSLAARAINQRAAGHHHWNDFTAENRGKTEKLARELHANLVQATTYCEHN